MKSIKNTILIHKFCKVKGCPNSHKRETLHIDKLMCNGCGTEVEISGYDLIVVPGPKQRK